MFRTATPEGPLLLGLAALVFSACSAEPVPEGVEAGGPASAAQLLERSIGFHDPDGVWSQSPIAIVQTATRPGGADRTDRVWIDNARSWFRLETMRRESPVTLEVGLDGGGAETVAVTVDGEVPSAELAEELRLDRKGALRLRNYYVYLFGLPMKLRDPGTRLDETVGDVEVDGVPAKRLRVTYDAEVGSDIWYFDIEPASGELLGYRFYHDEATADGEYIELEGLVDIGALRLPAVRAWYRFEQDEYLGTDSLAQQRN